MWRPDALSSACADVTRVGGAAPAPTDHHDWDRVPYRGVAWLCTLDPSTTAPDEVGWADGEVRRDARCGSGGQCERGQPGGAASLSVLGEQHEAGDDLQAADTDRERE